MEGERETREEVKCNRGFIVCGSSGRERSERRREREETRRRETVGTACWPADLQTEASLPNNQTNAAQKTASTLETKLLWHKIKHSKLP